MSANGFRLDDFTIPRAGSDTLRRVLSRVWPALVRDLRELPRADGAPRDLYARVVTRVASLWTSDPTAAVRLARRPTIAPRVRVARADPSRLSLSAHHGLLLDLAMELSAARAFGPPLRVVRPPSGWRPVRAPSLGVEVLLDDAVSWIAFEDGALHVDGRRAELDASLRTSTGFIVREAWRAIDGRVSLALVDDNPAAMGALHPDRAGNALDLGARTPEAWCEALREALAIVDAYLPSLAPERRLLAQVIVPVGVDDERHDSCTYEGAPGAMYLSLHPDPVKLAEAIVHEFQHDKLHALMRLDALLENGREEGYRSPVRPDPRPLRGVLLAAHAFIAVAEMYRAMREGGHPASRHSRFEARAEAVRVANVEALALLRESAKVTAVGRQLLEELVARAQTLT